MVEKKKTDCEVLIIKKAGCVFNSLRLFTFYTRSIPFSMYEVLEVISRPVEDPQTKFKRFWFVNLGNICLPSRICQCQTLIVHLWNRIYLSYIKFQGNDSIQILNFLCNQVKPWKKDLFSYLHFPVIGIIISMV